MNIIPRRCTKCHQIKSHMFFSSQHKSTCLSCYKDTLSEQEKTPSKRKITSAYKYVYLIRGGNLTKIGITRDISKRLRTLSVASPVPLFLLFKFISENARQTETILHDRFSHKKSHGEWFYLSEQDIEQIKLEFS